MNSNGMYCLLKKITSLSVFRFFATLLFFLNFLAPFKSLAHISYQQHSTLDSLKGALKLAQADTVKVKILAELSENCEISEIKSYTDPLIKLCREGLKPENKKSSLYKFYLRYYSDALTNYGYYLKQQGEIEAALKCYDESLAIKKELNDQKGVSLVLNNTAMILYNLGNITKALEYHFESLKLQEEIKNISGIANSLNNIGGIYDNLGEHNKALEFFNKSLKLRKELKDEEGIATCLTNIGFIYLTLGDTATALNYCKNTLAVHTSNGNMHGLAYDLNNLGFIYLNTGNADTALQLYNKSLRIRKDLGDKVGVAYSQNNIAGIYTKQKKYREAIELAENSLKTGLEIGYPIIIRDAALSLKKNYEYLNKPLQALKMYELHIQMRDSINNIETKKASLKNQYKYEFEKKEALLKEQRSKEKLVNHEKNQKQKIIIWATSAGLLLLVIFSFFVFNRLRVTRAQKLIIETQKQIVDEKQKEIMDSIRYAKRIQYALLASDNLLDTYLPEYFVLFKPKDVVSGDFYWATPTPSGFIYITADCTGHGVPGAFMSLLNISKLSQIINEGKVERPDLILNAVRSEIITALNPKGSEGDSKDGMDAVLCKLDIANMKLEYAAANNSFYIVRNKTLITCKADKMPVGKGHDDSISFNYNTVDLQKGDMIYTFTDGYADQFGGEKGKKYKYKKMEELLLAISAEKMDIQKQKLNESFENWKGNLEQVDDLCILGIRV